MVRFIFKAFTFFLLLTFGKRKIIMKCKNYCQIEVWVDFTNKINPSSSQLLQKTNTHTHMWGTVPSIFQLFPASITFTKTNQALLGLYMFLWNECGQLLLGGQEPIFLKFQNAITEITLTSPLLKTAMLYVMQFYNYTVIINCVVPNWWQNPFCWKVLNIAKVIIFKKQREREKEREHMAFMPQPLDFCTRIVKYISLK